MQHKAGSRLMIIFNVISTLFFVFIQFFLSNVSWFSQFSSTGCLTHTDSRPLVHLQQHVQDGRKESLDGFVTTFSKMLPPHGNGGMFALDCEMVSSTGFCLLENNVVSAELSHHSFCGRFFFFVSYSLTEARWCITFTVVLWLCDALVVQGYLF